jgi:hypothetical protein
VEELSVECQAALTPARASWAPVRGHLLELAAACAAALSLEALGSPLLDAGAGIAVFGGALGVALSRFGWRGFAAAAEALCFDPLHPDDVPLVAEVLRVCRAGALEMGALTGMVGLTLVFSQLEDLSALGPALRLTLLGITYGLGLAATCGLAARAVE